MTAIEKKYIQVTEPMLSEDVWKRELAPLHSIRDNYKKSCCLLILALMPPMMSLNRRTSSIGCLMDEHCNFKKNSEVFATQVQNSLAKCALTCEISTVCGRVYAPPDINLLINYKCGTAHKAEDR